VLIGYRQLKRLIVAHIYGYHECRAHNHLQAAATFAIAYLVAYQYDSMTLAATLFFSLAIVTPSLRTQDTIF
jgi:hypothetical protein